MAPLQVSTSYVYRWCYLVLLVLVHKWYDIDYIALMPCYLIWRKIRVRVPIRKSFGKYLITFSNQIHFVYLRLFTVKYRRHSKAKHLISRHYLHLLVDRFIQYKKGSFDQNHQPVIMILMIVIWIITFKTFISNYTYIAHKSCLSVIKNSINCITPLERKRSQLLSHFN